MLRGTNMIELDVFFYCTLGESIYPVKHMPLNWPMFLKWNALVEMRRALSTFDDGTDRSKAFPETAVIARQIVAEIEKVIPISQDQPREPSPVSKEHVQ